MAFWLFAILFVALMGALGGLAAAYLWDAFHPRRSM